MKLLHSSLLLTVGAMAGLIAYANWKHPAANRAFVAHTLAMDTIVQTWRHPDGGWAHSTVQERAIQSNWLAFQVHRAITLTEAVIGLLCAIGGLILPIHKIGRSIGIAGLWMGIMLWYGGFRVIGGEYFQMWQSAEWNGLPDAERIAAMLGIVWLIVRED